MNRYFLILTLLITTFSVQAQFDAVKKNVGQKSIQDRYYDYLKTKGYGPEIDKDGDLKFLYNNRSYYITIDINDKNFFRLARIANLKLDSPAQITNAEKVCHQVTRDVKVAKVYWSKGQIWVSSEQILPDPSDFETIFDRTLKLTESAYLKFIQDWKAATD